MPSAGSPTWLSVRPPDAKATPAAAAPSSVRRRKLEEQWAEEGRVGDRDAFVREGLEEYDGSLRRKLIVGVYVVPLALIAVIIYLVNFA